MNKTYTNLIKEKSISKMRSTEGSAPIHIQRGTASRTEPIYAASPESTFTSAVCKTGVFLCPIRSSPVKDLSIYSNAIWNSRAFISVSFGNILPISHDSNLCDRV